MERQAVISGFRRVLPTGGTLGLDDWRRRHKAIVIVLWAHVLILPAFGVARGQTLLHALIETSLPLVLALGATRPELGRMGRSMMATIGLLSCSAILTHFSGGLIEMHFHFFVVVAVITLYQSWYTFGVAIGFVALHHTVGGLIDPMSVFNHHAAIAHPFKWALIHAAFILGESAACITAWNLNERALEGERSARVSLERANADLGRAQMLARLGSWEWDIASGDLEWSDELYRIMGVERGSFEPTFDGFFSMVHPDDREELEAYLEGAIAGASGVDIEYRIVTPDGATRIMHAIGAPTLDEDGDIVRLIGTCQDVTERRLLEQEVQFRALHDPLTKLANRALFVDRLSHAITWRDREERLTSVLFLDLDDFKAVNDSLGHAAGDELLIEVGRRIEEILRPSDTIARFGGDEFAVLLEGADEAVAEDVAGRIQESLGKPVTIEGHQVRVQTSIGILVGTGYDSADDMLRDADIAMYHAKMQGKNSCEIFNREMRGTLLDRLELKADMRHSLDRGDFVLHFQPIVNIDSGQVRGMEALVRWNHPERGLIPPIDFIPLAEESGLIVPLGAWVLQEATRGLKAIQELLGRRLSVSVNVSARQLTGPKLLGVVDSALFESGLDPSDLVLELTETVLLEGGPHAVETMQALRDRGVRIAIDDFGTGYSSLAYLRSFPVDILKIDRSFVSEVDAGPEECALTEAIVKMASILSLETVAEGVETEAQLEKLRSMGCHTAQGYLFSKPLPENEVEGRLRELIELAAQREVSIETIKELVEESLDSVEAAV